MINPAEANIVVQREKMAEMKGVEIPAENHPEHVITALFGAEKITNSDLIIAAATFVRKSRRRHRPPCSTPFARPASLHRQ